MNAHVNREIRKDVSLLPAYILLILWLIFSVITIGWIVGASFSTTREIFSNNILKSGLHFENYKKAWIGNNIYKYFINSIIYTFVSGFLILLISCPAAYVLGRMKFRGRNLIMNSFVISMSIPGVMIIIPLFSVMVRLHLIGSMFTLIILYIGANVPFNVFFLTSFFATLPRELEESALVDGCTPYKTFWKIMLPLAQPGIITVGIFNFMGIWNEYFMALIFANKTSIRTLSVGLQAILQSMTYTGDWAGLFAAVVIVFLPTFILYLFMSEKIIAGITVGAVKG